MIQRPKIAKRMFQKRPGSPISSSGSTKVEGDEPDSSNMEISSVISISPNHRIDEDNESFFMSIDVPGFQKEDLKVSIADSVMSVLGKRIENQHKQKGIEFKITLSLDPQKVQLSDDNHVSEQIAADLSLGVLTIKVPKKEGKPPHMIPILVDTNTKQEIDKSME